MPITTVLLDAGNTLVELDFAALAGHFAAEGVEVAAGELRRAAGEGRGILNRYLAEQAGSTENRDTLRFYFDLICDGVGISDTDLRPRVLARIAPVIHDLWCVPGDGAAEAVRELSEAGYRLGVVSNSNGEIDRILAKAGLAKPFEVIVDSGVVGVEKPDPRIFEIALERLDVKPEEAVYVGDLPWVDVRGATAAGIRPILIDPWDAFPEVDVVKIRALGEIRNVLRQ
jgi:putative hydrolase of the HAD superfamily